MLGALLDDSAFKIDFKDVTNYLTFTKKQGKYIQHIYMYA